MSENLKRIAKSLTKRNPRKAQLDGGNFINSLTDSINYEKDHRELKLMAKNLVDKVSKVVARINKEVEDETGENLEHETDEQIKNIIGYLLKNYNR